MLYDYLFLSSNFFLLFLPIFFYFLNSYSSAIEKTLTQKPAEDNKKFHNNNSRFHILFKIVFILVIVFSSLQVGSLLVLNIDLIKVNNLLRIGFDFYLFYLLQTVMLMTNFFLIFFSFLYFRFKPTYRHRFIQKLFKIFTVLIIAGGSIGLILYYNLVIHLSIPELLTYSSKSIPRNFLELNSITYGPLLILFFIFTYTYRLFSKKRNAKTSNLYLITYFITIIMIAILFFNFGLKYFDIFGATSTKLHLFHHSTFYAGLVLTYLFSLSFYGIIFSIFISLKKSEFIGNQFAVSYSLKLAQINYYSTLGLVLITIFPWVMLNFYNYL